MTTSAKRTFLDFHAAPEPPTGSRLSRPHTSPTLTFFAMAHYSCRVTVSKGRVMQRCGWTSGNSGDFSAFAADPITLQTSLLLRNTAQRRGRATKSHCHSLYSQLPLISFQRCSPGSAETGAGPMSTCRAVASCSHDKHPATCARTIQLISRSADFSSSLLRLCGVVLCRVPLAKEM